MKKQIIKIFIIIGLTASAALPAKEEKDVIHYFRILHRDTIKSLKEQLKVNNDPVSYEVKDIQNGYLKYSFATSEGFSEFALWKKQDGKVITGEVSYGCGPGCSLMKFRLTEFTGDVPKDVTETYYPEKDVQKLYEKRLAILKKRDTESTPEFWIKLPRKGKTISIGIMLDAVELTGFIGIAEMRFKNDKFEYNILK